MADAAHAGRKSIFTMAMPPMFEQEELPPPSPLTWRERLNPFTKAYGTTERPEKKERGGASVLPVPFDTYVNMSGQLDKTAIRQFSLKFERDLVYSSDLLGLIVRTKTNETFRNGMEISPRFQSKCTKCEREYEEEKVFCPYDGAETRLPDYEQWKQLNAFVQRTNRWDDALLTTMRQVDTDVHIDDNGWLFLQRYYEFGDDGAIERDEVQGIVRFDGNMMHPIMSRYGIGTSETGQFAYFCIGHRQEVVEFPEEGDYRCRKPGCGLQLLPAWYAALTKAEKLYYGPKEIYHVKLYSNTQGFGVSPIIQCYMKVLSLQRMDKFILDAYSLQRSPQELLILRGRKDSIHRAWMLLMQKARENPNMVYPLVLEGDESKGNRVVEHETFALKPIEWSWGDMRKEFRDVVGRLYGVQPIFATGSETGGGLANEGLQIAVTTLAIKQSQQVWNMFLDFLSRQLGCADYRITLNPNEQEDEIRDLDVQEKRVAIAKDMKSFGYGIEFEKDSKGRVQFKFVEKQAEEALPTADALPVDPEAEDAEGENPFAAEGEEDEAPVAEEKSVPRQPDMTPEEVRTEGGEESKRAKENPIPDQNPVAPINAALAKILKANYRSKPRGNIRAMPRGDEDANMQETSDPKTETFLGQHAGGM